MPTPPASPVRRSTRLARSGLHDVAAGSTTTARSSSTTSTTSRTIKRATAAEIRRSSSEDDLAAKPKRTGWRRFMNERAKSHEDYQPTVYEETANVVTHAFGILVAAVSLCFLVYRAESYIQKINAWVYGGSMVLLFITSSTYHSTCLCYRRRDPIPKLLQRLDHGVIFVFIAASYTPWLTMLDIGENNSLGQTMITVIWSMAVAGILHTMVFFNKYKFLELALYLGMGWCIVIVGDAVYRCMPEGSVLPLLLGGIFFSSGTIFLSSDGIIIFAHAIWHIFVLAGVLVHLYAVYTFLM